MRVSAWLTAVTCVVVAWHPTGAKVKCVSAEGMLICPKDPTKVADVEVYLMDADGFLNSDDTMGWAMSNENGIFQVDGCSDDVLSVPDPYLKISSQCGPMEKVVTTDVQYVFRPNVSNFGIIDISGE